MDWVVSVDAVQDVVVVVGDGVERHDMVGKATIMSVILTVKDQVDQVESGQESGWEFDVVDH